MTNCMENSSRMLQELPIYFDTGDLRLFFHGFSYVHLAVFHSLDHVTFLERFILGIGYRRSVFH